jgi:hypothetical protein
LVPELVTLHVWGVSGAQVPSALAAVAAQRRAVQRSAGLTFAKMLGTGSGRSFTLAGADPRHWALLACWADVRAAAAFERSAVVRGWDERSVGMGGERLRVLMSPLASRGRWAGREPFGSPAEAAHDGPVAALTHARIRPSRVVAFWRAVPAVSKRLQGCSGLRLALGIAEVPVGVQGTFSVWDSVAQLRAFAYGSAEHAAVIARTAEAGWYGEELFARLAVLEAHGTVGGVAATAIP